MERSEFSAARELVQIEVSVTTLVFCYLKNGQDPASFCLFSSYSHCNFNNTNLKSIDGVLGIRTNGHRMVVGADDTTDLWCFLPTICNTHVTSATRLLYLYKVNIETVSGPKA